MIDYHTTVHYTRNCALNDGLSSIHCSLRMRYQCGEFIIFRHDAPAVKADIIFLTSIFPTLPENITGLIHSACTKSY